MDQTSHHTEPKPEAAIPRLTAETDHLLTHLDAAWPDYRAQRDIAGLPRSLFHALCARRPPRSVARAAAHLDRALPAWPERAASALAAAAPQGVGEDQRRLAALLAHRLLRDPEPLLRAAASTSDPEARLWLLAALSGTDTPAVRAAWLDYLRRGVQAGAAEPDPASRASTALWFAFLHAFLGGWLTYTDFRDALTSGRVLTAAHPKGDYRRALRRLGLTSHPVFTKWYRQVVYEVAHQPDVSLSLRDGGWIRDFPGEDYLFDALAELQRKPDSWWPLHILRWTSGIDSADAGLAQRLREASPISLSLLSLLRPDLCPAVGDSLGAPNHQAVLQWLKTTGPAAPLDVEWAEHTLRPWAETIGESMTLAAGALCSIEPPPDFTGPADPALRCRAFVRSHLLPEFDRVMDNLCCIHALRRTHFDTLAWLARKGRPPALRALALWPEKAPESAAILFHLARRGPKLARQAARESLDTLASRAGATDHRQLEVRLDLASAWSDAGLEGRPARVWWDVAGYHIKLSVAAGAVTLRAFGSRSSASGSRPLATLPKAVRQDPQYAEIREARAELARGYRYFRRRFEDAMVDGITYSGRDFAALLANPMVRSLISRLILILDGAPFHWTPPDPLDDCRPPAEIARASRVAIAHPLDLIQLGALADWQQRVIDTRIAQPFKQAFREIYLVSEAERAATSGRRASAGSRVSASLRFAGRRLVARRAFALLRARAYSPGRGDAVKEWPVHGLRAHLQWAAPDEPAGRLLATTGPTDPVTSGPVWFETQSGETIPLTEVPPVVFSETLRDADLLVSRATAGELGFSSEEVRRLRATLVRYLARAVGLTTIYVGEDHTHVIVEGERAMYRVHLGSGSVLLENTRRHLDLGSLADKWLDRILAESMDSLTARILGTIGALCHDEEITDPHFLAQLL